MSNKSEKKIANESVNDCVEPCFVEIGMRLIGSKWTGTILWHLKDGPVRFNELSRMIGGASKKMISERLRFLERKGLISRTIKDTNPISVYYEVTDLGSTALEILGQIQSWTQELPPSIIEDLRAT